MTALLPCQRPLFDIPEDVCYLNSAYISPMLRASKSAIMQGLEAESRPWRITVRDFFEPVELLRAEVANLVRCAPDDVAIVPSASYGIATAAANLFLAKGQSILILEDQYPSNVYTWQRLAQESGGRLRRVPRPADGDWTAAVLGHIDESTAIVAVPNCHWMDGALVDLHQVSARTRTMGAALVIDASQSLGVLPLYVDQITPDFLVAAAYKSMLCPYSVSFLYVSPERRDGTPLEENALNRANGKDFPGLYRTTEHYADGARRYDVGERANFTLLPGAIAAVRQLNEWGVERTCATLAALTGQIAYRAKDLGLSVLPADRRAGHFVGLRFPRGVPDTVVEKLLSRHVFVSRRGDSIRVTPHLYNGESDVERLFEVLELAATI